MNQIGQVASLFVVTIFSSSFIMNKGSSFSQNIVHNVHSEPETSGNPLVSEFQDDLDPEDVFSAQNIVSSEFTCTALERILNSSNLCNNLVITLL